MRRYLKRNQIRWNIFSPITDKESGFFLGEYGKGGRASFNRVQSLKANPLFPKAKCIFVFKNYEASRRFRLLGTYRITRYYGIAVLTDENKYYYNEYRSTATALAKQNVLDMERLFIDGYNIDENTKIMLSKNITDKNEPIYLFLKIIAKIYSIQISRKTPDELLTIVNSEYKLLTKCKYASKNPKKNSNHMRWIRSKLLDLGLLDFLPPDMKEKIASRETRRRTRHLLFWCAIGTLILFKRNARSVREKEREKEERIISFVES